MYEEYFVKNYNKAIEDDHQITIDGKLQDVFSKTAAAIIPQLLPAIDDYFNTKDWKLIETEHLLYTEIEEKTKKFKGFIDAIIQTPDNKYHLIDWKTATYWDARKRSDPLTVYQPVFYKHFYNKSIKVDPKQIECHFGLLKKSNNKKRIELFKVTSGKKRTQNALTLLNNSVKGIEQKKYIKNRLSCRKYNCPFLHTKYCR